MNLKEELKQNKLLLRTIVEKLVPLDKLVPRLSGIDSAVGNIPCIFHENHGSPHAKMYYDETKNIWIIRCYVDGRNYTSFDYIEKQMDSTTPYEYLFKHKNISEITEIYEIISKGFLESGSRRFEQKVNYINNLYAECDYDMIEYIERLYTCTGDEE